MTWAARLALILALVSPAAASARPQQNPAVCVHLAHQLVHYDTQKQRAAKLGNAMWVARFDAQLDKLEDEFAAKCPDAASNTQIAKIVRDLLVAAGQGALTFFTLGAF